MSLPETLSTKEFDSSRKSISIEDFQKITEILCTRIDRIHFVSRLCGLSIENKDSSLLDVEGMIVIKLIVNNQKLVALSVLSKIVQFDCRKRFEVQT